MFWLVDFVGELADRVQLHEFFVRKGRLALGAYVILLVCYDQVDVV